MLLLEDYIDPTSDEDDIFEDKRVTVSSIYEKLKLYWKTRNTYSPAKLFFIVKHVAKDLMYLSYSVTGVILSIASMTEPSKLRTEIWQYYKSHKKEIGQIAAIVAVVVAAISAIRHLLKIHSGKRHGSSRHPIINLVMLAKKLQTEFLKDVEGLPFDNVDRIKIHITYLEKAISEIRKFIARTQKAAYKNFYRKEIEKINNEITYFRGLL